MHSYLTKVFSSLGFKERDAEIYTTCLSPVGLFMHEIVERTGIKRSTAVISIERLVERGLIRSVTEGARQKFYSEEPVKIIAEYQEHFQNFKTLIPLLLADRDEGGLSRPKIRFFDGAEGIKSIHHDILIVVRTMRDKNKEILAVSSGEDVFKVNPFHQKTHIDKRVKAGISLRWIAPDIEFHRSFVDTDGSQYRKMKFFDPKKYPFHIEIDIYGDNVAFMDLKEPASGVIIENKKLATSLRSLYQMIWDFLPES